MRNLRVLVVDDSPANRSRLSTILNEHGGVEVVGVAGDGDEALRLSASLSPDLITLDLEMPRMDGFTFLRLLMATRPTAVVVISSHNARDDVFRALELGAIDFIAKPDAGSGPEALRAQLTQVLAIVRQLSPARLLARRMISARPVPEKAATRTALGSAALRRVVAVAASTGGPTALMELFAGLAQSDDTAILIAQHMPERFTRSFAERLDRQGGFRVREADHGVELSPSAAFVCPGGRCLELERRDGMLLTKVSRPNTTDRYAPSADRLFLSVARVMSHRTLAVVLTGMGDDGAQGVVALKQAGGRVLAESEQTAVVYGMPKVAAQTGCVDEQLPLPELVSRVRELLSSRN
jgi:two-component system, chemotaxis family, protein-glutamate methylesterase/glutaminase